MADDDFSFSDNSPEGKLEKLRRVIELGNIFAGIRNKMLRLQILNTQLRVLGLQEKIEEYDSDDSELE